MADLAVGRVAAIQQRVDHRVLEVRAPPPGDEAAGLAVPALLLQERRDGLGQPFLHVDDGAVLIESQRLDLALEDLGAFHTCLSKAQPDSPPRHAERRVFDTTRGGVRGGGEP